MEKLKRNETLVERFENAFLATLSGQYGRPQEKTQPNYEIGCAAVSERELFSTFGKSAQRVVEKEIRDRLDLDNIRLDFSLAKKSNQEGKVLAEKFVNAASGFRSDGEEQTKKLDLRGRIKPRMEGGKLGIDINMAGYVRNPDGTHDPYSYLLKVEKNNLEIGFSRSTGIGGIRSASVGGLGGKIYFKTEVGLSENLRSEIKVSHSSFSSGFFRGSGANGKIYLLFEAGSPESAEEKKVMLGFRKGLG